MVTKERRRRRILFIKLLEKTGTVLQVKTEIFGRFIGLTLMRRGKGVSFVMQPNRKSDWKQPMYKQLTVYFWYLAPKTYADKNIIAVILCFQGRKCRGKTAQSQ